MEYIESCKINAAKHDCVVCVCIHLHPGTYAQTCTHRALQGQCGLLMLERQMGTAELRHYQKGHSLEQSSLEGWPGRKPPALGG